MGPKKPVTNSLVKFPYCVVRNFWSAVTSAPLLPRERLRGRTGQTPLYETDWTDVLLPEAGSCVEDDARLLPVSFAMSAWSSCICARRTAIFWGTVEVDVVDGVVTVGAGVGGGIGISVGVGVKVGVGVGI